jgi:hypothetical protein
MPESMMQQAPYPHELDKLVAQLKYRPGWQFYLAHQDRGQGSQGLTLDIIISAPDTYHPEQTIRVRHSMIVPPAAYDRRSWRRWLFEQILLVERHEACEFFQIDGGRPYAPNHGPGNDCYIVFEEGSLQEKRTSYLGEERDTDAPDDD